jgi:hypothetical protein
MSVSKTSLTPYEQMELEKAALIHLENKKMNPWTSRSICQYGEKCYRQNPLHYEAFRHEHLEKALFSENITEVNKLSRTDRLTSLKEIREFLSLLPHNSKRGVLVGSRGAVASLTHSRHEFYRTIDENTDYDVILQSWQLIAFLDVLEKENNDGIASIVLYCNCVLLQQYKVHLTLQGGLTFEFEIAVPSSSSSTCDKNGGPCISLSPTDMDIDVAETLKENKEEEKKTVVSEEKEPLPNSNALIMALANDEYLFTEGTTLLPFKSRKENKDEESNAYSELEFYIPSIEVLHAIKCSHIYFNIFWLKTIEDIHFFRKCSNSFMLQSEKLKQLTETRRKEVEIRLGQSSFGKQTTMNQSNEQFFKQSENKVERPFEHDLLHDKVAFEENKPIFKTFKRDETKAKLDWDLFEAAPERTQLNLVREEAMALALERYIIPANLAFEKKEEGCDFVEIQFWQKAYLNALQRICTNLWKGKFREFAIENYPALKWIPRDLKQIYKTHFYRPFIRMFTDRLTWMTHNVAYFNQFCSEEKALQEAPKESLGDFLKRYFEVKEEEEESESNNNDDDGGDDESVEVYRNNSSSQQEEDDALF